MKIMVVTPGYIPLASVGKMRMLSLIKHLKNKHNVTVVHDSVKSYNNITTEKPIEGVEEYEVNVKPENFLFNVHSYKKFIKVLMRKSNYDVVILSVGPFYILPLVKEIKAISDIKVILDYRDLWSVSYRENEKLNKLKSWIKSVFFEKNALVNADAITCYSDSGIKMLTEQYPFLANKKTRGIMNGYDEKELVGLSNRYSPDSECNICKIYIFGKFSVYFSEKNWVWFADVILRKEAETGVKIEIHHIGNEESNLHAFLKMRGIHYECLGYFPYREGMEHLLNDADVLLGAADVMYGVGTKVFDYIFLKRPILMYAPEGSELKHFVSDLNLGFSFSSENEFDKALGEILINTIPMTEHNTEKYSRYNQNLQFETLINELISGNR